MTVEVQAAVEGSGSRAADSEAQPAPETEGPREETPSAKADPAGSGSRVGRPAIRSAMGATDLGPFQHEREAPGFLKPRRRWSSTPQHRLTVWGY